MVFEQTAVFMVTYGLFLCANKNKGETMSKQTVVEELKPRTQDEISIVMSCDDNYAPYLATTLQSIIDNAKQENYTVYILVEKLSKDIERNLLKMATEKVHVRHINVKNQIEQYSADLFFTHWYFSIAIYYRLFIPYIFKYFKKVIYCDCDAIFMVDPADLYQEDIIGKLMAGVVDFGVFNLIHKKDTYYTDILKLKNPANYINSGLLIFNIPDLLSYHFTEKCMECLQRLKNPKFPDQDIINVVCEDKIAFLDFSWNMLGYLGIEADLYIPKDKMAEYKQGLENPKFMHFAGRAKPWNDLDILYANVWWKYARKTPLYEQMRKMFFDRFSRNSSRFNYIRCSILFYLTWGKRKQHYMDKKHHLKRCLEKFKHF